PGLELIRKVEAELARIWTLPSETEVGAAVSALNAEIAKVNARAAEGPPTRLATLDVESIVREWRRRGPASGAGRHAPCRGPASPPRGSGVRRPLMAFNGGEWVAETRHPFEPPVGNKVIWEDSQFTAMIIRGPNARRDFHVDPSDEIFYMLRGDMVLEYMQDGRRQSQVIREGGLLLVPAFTPHAPHRPADTWGRDVQGQPA